jgi:sugar phosphate isomerase/epimerase
MRLAISNIAWDTAEDSHVAEILHRHNMDAIDVAPGKYFPEPKTAEDEKIQQVRRFWEDRGIAITGMQALLFGTAGLNLFGPAESQNAMLDHLGNICRIGAGLGATRLVFGSPKNRDRGGLTDEQAAEVAIPFLQSLGDIAAAHAVTICLEPNPPKYGCNFMTTSEATAGIVQQVSHPAIRMQLDTGAITINSENPNDVAGNYSHLIGHVHASEPDLVPLGDGVTDHGRMAAALKNKLPNHIVSIEMLATAREPHLQAIERALGVAIRYYRAEQRLTGSV